QSSVVVDVACAGYGPFVGLAGFAPRCSGIRAMLASLVGTCVDVQLRNGRYELVSCLLHDYLHTVNHGPVMRLPDAAASGPLVAEVTPGGALPGVAGTKIVRVRAMYDQGCIWDWSVAPPRVKK
ncbi:MAG TPA: hypothetical protein VKD22_14280, partial [Ramlibacter sp.]|nr:hypothetical protein [Ramlibacter sp.]